MFAATLFIDSIDYEKTLLNTYPFISKEITRMNSDHLAIRFLKQLGDAATPVLTGILHQLSEDTKNELLLKVFDGYSPMILIKLKEILKKDSLGSCFDIGRISLQQQNGIRLNIDQVTVDHLAFLRNEKVSQLIQDKLGGFSSMLKFAAGIAVAVRPKEIEDLAIHLLCDTGNKTLIKKMISESLENHGIILSIKDVAIYQVDRPAVDIVEVNKSFRLSKEMEDKLLSATASYLKELMTR